MTIREAVTRLSLFPSSAGVNEKGHLIIGGCDTVALAYEFGTPLYVFDEMHLRTPGSRYDSRRQSPTNSAPGNSGRPDTV